MGRAAEPDQCGWNSGDELFHIQQPVHRVAALDPGSYTYIVGGGSGLDLDTFGGSAPFVVEQGVPAGTRLFELKVNNAKPPAAEVGGYNLAGNGQMTFSEGF